MNDTLVSDPKAFLNELQTSFFIGLNDAKEIISSFHNEMRLGLEGSTSSLKMIPSFVSRPSGNEKGNFLAIDLGGTNLRVLSVTLDGKGKAETTAVSRFMIPKEIMTGTENELFDFIVDSISLFLKDQNVARDKEYPLSFTFSFPVEQHSIVSGTLICWAKGFNISGMVGKDVVDLLSEALKRKQMSVYVASLANDTVGTLLARSYSDKSSDIGVILGTGTNACYPEKSSNIKKIQTKTDSEEMIINIEWGNFNKLKTNRFDQYLDKNSHNQGKQQLEKMVSGMYLGEIARLIIFEMTERGLLFKGKQQSIFETKNGFTTEHLANFAEDKEIINSTDYNGISATDRQFVIDIARIVSTRSARLAGTAIAAVISWMDPQLDNSHTVAIDGSLFEKYPGFQDEMKIILSELFESRSNRITYALVKDGSGIGSAIIGAVATSSSQMSRPGA